MATYLLHQSLKFHINSEYNLQIDSQASNIFFHLIINERRLKMPKIIAFLTFIGVCATCLAASPSKIPPRMTVKMLIDHYSSDATQPLGQQSVAAMNKEAFASGYLAGVADAGEGRVWCNTGKVKRDEIDADVFSALKKLPAAEQGMPAGPFITQILGKQFPCK